jgi:hypothetical protein
LLKIRPPRCDLQVVFSQPTQAGRRPVTRPERIDMSDEEVEDVIEQGPAPSRRRTRLALVAAGAAGLVLVGGGVALATTSGSSSAPSSGSSSAAGEGQSGAGPAGDRPSGAPASGGKEDGQRPTPQPRLAGSVKSVSGSDIVITDMQGFTRTIKVSSSTKYEDSLTATPAAGTKIMATGTVDADGTTLDATDISAPKAPADGGGPGHGGLGHGGPGRGEGQPPAGTKPTDSSTPSAKTTS